MCVRDRGGAQGAPERPGLEHEAGEDGHRQQDVGGQAARTREDPERGVSHRRPPARRVRPSAVTSTHGRPRCRLRERLAPLPAGRAPSPRPRLSTASRSDDGESQEIAVGRGACRRVDQVVQLAAVPAPAPAIAARRGQRAGGELEREAAVGRLYAHRPCSAVDGHVAAGVDERRARRAQQQGRAYSRIALADAPEIEPDLGAQLDPGPVDANGAAARRADDHGRPVLREPVRTSGRIRPRRQRRGPWDRNGRRSSPGPRARARRPPGARARPPASPLSFRRESSDSGRKRERIASSRWNSSSAAASASPASAASTSSSMSVPIARNRRVSITKSS